MSWRAALLLGLVTGLLFFISFQFNRSSEPKTSEEQLTVGLKQVQTTGNVDNFPTPMSWWRFGAFLHSLILGIDYDEEYYGPLRVASKPIYLFLNWNLNGQIEKESFVGPSFHSVVDSLRRFLNQAQLKLELGCRLTAYMASYLEPEAKRVLSRVTRLQADEGLAIESRIFLPDELIQLGALSQAGEVRPEILAEEFPDSHSCRQLLLNRQAVFWTRIKFKKLSLDVDGLHFPADAQRLTVENISRQVNSMVEWIEEKNRHLDFSVIRPYETPSQTKHSFLSDFETLKVALECSLLPEPEKKRLQRLVAARQKGPGGWIYKGQLKSTEYQLKAAILGLMEEHLSEIDGWFSEDGVCQPPEDFVGLVDDTTVFRYFFYRQRFDLIDLWISRYLDHVNINESSIRKLFPLLCQVNHPKAAAWVNRTRSYFLLENRHLMDNTGVLLEFLEGLRVLSEKNYFENRRLIEGSRQLLERLAPAWNSSLNSYWKSGVRVGYLSSTLSVSQTFRAINHLDWMLDWLENQWIGSLPTFQGQLKNNHYIFYINSGPHRYLVNAVPSTSEAQAMELSGAFYFGGLDKLPSPLPVPIYLCSEASQNVPNKAFLISKNYLVDPGVLLENEGSYLKVRLLTADGEFVFGAHEGFEGQSALNLTKPVELIQSLYDRNRSGRLILTPN